MPHARTTMHIQYYLPALTGARFVAAMAVAAAHCFNVVVFSDARWLAAIGAGLAYFGMSLFFVLSGFVIYLNYAPLFRDRPAGEAVRRFAVARFARLYPLYLFLMALCLVTIPPQRVPAMLPDLWWWVPLLQSWLPGDGKRALIFTVEEAALTWSISTELFFYAAFPLICAGVFRPMRWRVYPAVELPLFFAAALAAMYGLSLIAAPLMAVWAPNMPGGEAMFWLAYYSPYCRLLEFMAGLLVARAYLELRTVPVSRGEARGAAVVAAACIAYLAWMALNQIEAWDVFSSLTRSTLWRTPAIVFLLFYLARYDSGLSRVLSSRAAVTGGDASYSIYLLHLFIAVRFAGPERELSALSVAEWLVRMSIYLAVVLCLAYGTYHLIEAPARRWIRNLFDRSAARRVQPAPLSVSAGDKIPQ